MQQQSSKKWLIILLVILFLCAAAFGVWYFFLREEENDDSLQANFNHYANFILFQEESNRPIPTNYDKYHVYALEAVVEKPEETDKEFFEKAQQLLQKFADQYLTEKGRSVEYGIVLDHEKDLGVLSQYVETGFLSFDDITAYYKKNGSNKTDEYIEKFYSVYNEDFASEHSEYDKLLLRYYIGTEKPAETLAELRASEFFNENYIAEQARFLVSQCWSIQNLIQNGNDKNEK